MFNVSVLDKKKIQTLMREGGKKHLRKKTYNLFLEKSDEIKQTLDSFLEKLKRVRK